MRRRIGALVAVLALVGVASGCSLREVQLWFAFNRHQAISREQAKNIADLVNSKKAPGGCDANYAGTCVPDNASQVHCAGTSGDGPAVRGPFTIAGWDSFELDPDGDKHVCDSPVGSFDVFGQELDGIRIKGWAFDPDTTDPVQLVVSTNGYVDQLAADESRGDLEAALPGVGANHGFDLSGDGWDPGEQVSVCVVALNVGTGSNTTLGCKNIVMQDSAQRLVQISASSSYTVNGLLEIADAVPGGYHLRGWAVDIGHVGSAVDHIVFESLGRSTGVGWTPSVVRSDVVGEFGLAPTTAAGFDYVLPANALPAGTTRICMNAVVQTQLLPVTVNLVCRNLNS